jgi:hypothetical protein
MTDVLPLLLTGFVTLVTALAGSAGLWSFLTRRGDRAAEREEKDVERLRAEVRELKDSHRTCEAEVDQLKARLAAVEHHHASYLARWIKGADKRVVWLNDKAVLSIFGPCGYTREQVIGHTFAELLDPIAAAEVDRLDRAALALPGAAVSSLIKLHPDLPVMHIVKVASSGRDGELIYEGHAFRTNDPDIALGAGLARHAEQRVASADRVIDAP